MATWRRTRSWVVSRSFAILTKVAFLFMQPNEHLEGSRFKHSEVFSNLVEHPSTQSKRRARQANQRRKKVTIEPLAGRSIKTSSA